jgi:hypothetical protein
MVNDMKTNHWHAMKSTLAGLVLALVASLAPAAPTVLPPHSNAFGMGYDELAADWLEWALSIPNAYSPLFDTDGSNAAIGQTGRAWFLAGNTGGSTTRTVSVPAGRPLFFPILNEFWVNTPELGDPVWSAAEEANARSLLAAGMDTAQNLVLQIDGRTIPNVYGHLRASSTVGTCMLPTDNLYGANRGPHPCVADGFWALLPPMSKGAHTIHFAGVFADFHLDVTYNLTILHR